MSFHLAMSEATSPAGLVHASQLWLPGPALMACVRGIMVRNTVGGVLTDAQRVNHFPASPLCSLSWWFAGGAETLVPVPGCTTGTAHDTTLGALGVHCNRVPLPGRWVLGGPQTRPCASWCPGAVHSLSLMLMPDALHLLTGLVASDLTDRFLDAEQWLPPDWLALCDAVQCAADDPARIRCLADFLVPRWQVCRPVQPLKAHRYADWAAYLAQRAMVSGPGRSLRQLERRIKRWAGLPLRELQGFGRAERAFFEVAARQTQGGIQWADVAADAGFADQAHLCRITKRMTGFSPAELQRGIALQEPFWPYRVWV